MSHTRRRASERPARVAVIGGGCAGIAAAFELTRPEHRGRYDVTVYQQGWRLGGKGASGRGLAGRIEEHGLHVWMGWYENAFRLLRQCYTELTGDADAWHTALVPAPLVAVTDRTPDGRWMPWKRAFPPAEGLPGDPPDSAPRWTVRTYLLRTIALLRTLFDDVSLRVGDEGAARATAQLLAGASLDRLVAYGELTTLAGVSQAIALLDGVIGARSDVPDAPVLRFLDGLGANLRRLLRDRVEHDAELRRVWYVIDLALATLRGYLTSGLLTDPRGFDAIDELDCREWLRQNGACEEALDSGYLRGLYDLGFGYEDGDVTRPRISAAQAVRGFVRAFFTYRGAFFWKLQAGMGDVVFAPFYDVLRRRGVRFRFFHRLTAVRLGRTGSPHVAALDFDVQARVKGGASAYDPLIDVAGMRCWPAEPLAGQLADGARCVREGRDFESHWDRRRVGRMTLRVGRDFDFVVLGVGLGAVPYVCSELVAADPRWRAMVEHVKTVATQAFQIWLDADMEALGWSDGPVTLSGFAEPFDTWADMRHLLPREGWTQPPRALAYFCGVLRDGASEAADAGHLARRRELVRRNAIGFLEQEIRHLWPKAVEGTGKFRWELLAVPPGCQARGAARFDAQHWTSSVNPSDRYTLALPGSARHRISPLDGTYDNLTVCGDWTDCGFNSGCVEAAVMSGRLAAHALSGGPALEDIVGYDHP